ncbi:Rv3654c family TadE-like protein [uncultured Amnibacterium sp.]|uniref:Rv3654c family TadE-like protein n=1 Tax=uncultured Amnibacterium sp. TaxID=1631851 RepID=UPI0035CC096A
MSGEEGAGTALAVALVAAIAACAVLLATVGVVLDTRRRVAAAADAAALAGADVALGAATGIPCDRAGEVAAANGARLASCEQSGQKVRVAATASVLGIPVRVVAVAGPPPAQP